MWKVNTEIIDTVLVKEVPKKNYKWLQALAFQLLIIFLCLFSWWMGGWNFERNSDTGVITALALILSLFPWLVIYNL